MILGSIVAESEKKLNIEDEPMVVNKIIEALGQIADGRATLRIIEKLKEEIDLIHSKYVSFGG